MHRIPDDTPPPLPLLITGIAGVAGYNAFHYFRARFADHVIGIRQEDNWPLHSDGIVACNAEDHGGLARLFDRYTFRSVLNCAGNCALKSCELDPPLAWRTNVESVDNLLDIVGDSDVRLVHLSIDLVFSGKGHGEYVEEDPSDPVTVYGKAMVAAERRILCRRPKPCILRISLPMGVSVSGHAGAIDWIQSRFKKSKPATLYFDEIRTPTYTDCLNLVCQTMLSNQFSGIFHAGGPRRMSLYQIAQVINRISGYNPDHLIGIPRLEAGPLPPRAGNVSLDSTKLASALGYDPFDSWPYFNDHVPTHRDWHRERSPGERGSPEYLAEVLYCNPGRLQRS